MHMYRINADWHLSWLLWAWGQQLLHRLQFISFLSPFMQLFDSFISLLWHIWFVYASFDWPFWFAAGRSLSVAQHLGDQCKSSENCHVAKLEGAILLDSFDKIAHHGLTEDSIWYLPIPWLFRASVTMPELSVHSPNRLIGRNGWCSHLYMLPLCGFSARRVQRCLLQHRQTAHIGDVSIVFILHAHVVFTAQMRSIACLIPTHTLRSRLRVNVSTLAPSSSVELSRSRRHDDLVACERPLCTTFGDEVFKSCACRSHRSYTYTCAIINPSHVCKLIFKAYSSWINTHIVLALREASRWWYWCITFLPAILVRTGLLFSLFLFSNL